MARRKGYATLTKENIAKLKEIARNEKDFDLFEALCGAGVSDRKRIELLWDAFAAIASGDGTKVSTDRRANLASRYKANKARWKKLVQWQDTDCDSKYANFYAEERAMLEWYLTESLVDIYSL